MTYCNLNKNAKSGVNFFNSFRQISSNNKTRMAYLFTSESVSEGHPDKVSDQISDALLDNFLAFDADSKVACETLVTTGQAVLAGEVKSNTYLDVQTIARNVINKIGYTKGAYQFSGDSCGVISLIHEQSQDINQGVDRGSKEEQGAGDQGMMFGYATKETDNYMPLALDISHKILQVLATYQKNRIIHPDLTKIMVRFLITSLGCIRGKADCLTHFRKAKSSRTFQLSNSRE